MKAIFPLENIVLYSRLCWLVDNQYLYEINALFPEW